MIERKRENIQIIKKTPLYEKFFKVDEYLLKFPLYNGGMSPLISREVMTRGKAAGVLLYDPDMERLVFVEQIRAGAFVAGEHPWLLECVAGMIDSGETPQEVAVREAKEEAGADVSDIEPIAEYFSSPGGVLKSFFCFAAALIQNTSLLMPACRLKTKIFALLFYLLKKRKKCWLRENLTRLYQSLPCNGF